MSKKNKNQNKKEDKSQQIYLGNSLATILKEVKPLFETRKGYGWDCPLKNIVDEDIAAVYEFNGEVYVVSCDLFDAPFGKLPSDIRNKVREEAIKWLKEQPQTQGKLRE